MQGFRRARWDSGRCLPACLEASYHPELAWGQLVAWDTGCMNMTRGGESEVTSGPASVLLRQQVHHTPRERFSLTAENLLQERIWGSKVESSTQV